MSRFFEDFPTISYSFGNTNYSVDFQHLGTYIDIVDQVKEYNTYYQDYYISEYERPDAVSSKLYNTPNYAWTFYLLNDKIRNSNWPVSTPRIYELSKVYYPNLVITTDSLLTLIGSSDQYLPLSQSSQIIPGKYVYFPSANIVYKVLRIDYDLGQLWLQPPPGVNAEIQEGDDRVEVVAILSSQTDIDPVMENAWNNLGGKLDTNVQYSTFEEIRIHRQYLEYEAPHHWEDLAGEYVWPELKDVEEVRGNLPAEAGADIALFNILDQNSFTNNPEYQSISYRGRLQLLNDDLRSIRVIRPESIVDIVSEFNRLLRERI